MSDLKVRPPKEEPERKTKEKRLVTFDRKSPPCPPEAGEGWAPSSSGVERR